MKAIHFMFLASIVCHTTAFALDPAPVRADSNQESVKTEDALFSRTAGAENPSVSFGALETNTNRSETPLLSWGWRLTGNLNVAREFHTATLLQNGMVLVAAGLDPSCPDGDCFLASAELYDPVTHIWTLTGSLHAARSGHPATLLPDGMVLVAGGSVLDPPYAIASAELYDPASGTWTNTGSLNTRRAAHTATLLQNGMVLVASGFDGESVLLASAELYDPARGTWTLTGSLNTARTSHTATLLPNGMVLVAAGFDGVSALASVELYDPANGTWTTTGGLKTARYRHTTTLLENGMVLVAGGGDLGAANDAFREAELYDPASGTWTATGSLNRPHAYHTATLLENGMVLVAGGIDLSGFSPTTELYDPASGTWTTTGKLNRKRFSHTATLLQNGAILIAGGSKHKKVQPTAEVGHTVR